MPANVRPASVSTADEAIAMFQENSSPSSPNGARKSLVETIAKDDRIKVIDRAKRSLAWSRDPARQPVPGAENMTDDQVSLT